MASPTRLRIRVFCHKFIRVSIAITNSGRRLCAYIPIQLPLDIFVYVCYPCRQGSEIVAATERAHPSAVVSPPQGNRTTVFPLVPGSSAGAPARTNLSPDFAPPLSGVRNATAPIKAPGRAYFPYRRGTKANRPFASSFRFRRVVRVVYGGRLEPGRRVSAQRFESSTLRHFSPSCFWRADRVVYGG